MLQMPRSN